jgi:hypothetical protein
MSDLEVPHRNLFTGIQLTLLAILIAVLGDFFGIALLAFLAMLLGLFGTAYVFAALR